MRLLPWQRPLSATLRLPGDKSITHRAILFSALVNEPMVVTGWLDAGDTRSSLRVAEALGVDSRIEGERLILQGPGGENLREPDAPLDCGNSGTTTRLTAGLAAGLRGLVVLTGDRSLRERPMARIADPLRQLGVTVLTRSGGRAPLAIAGGPHRGGAIRLSVASAQVKSALLLAGLSADEPLTVEEPIATRDHTERLLAAMGAAVTVVDRRVTIEPGRLYAVDVEVPGDPSSGAFWATLAALLPGSSLRLEHVSLNPGRIGFYRTLQRMGANVRWEIDKHEPEPIGDIIVEPGDLRGITVKAEEVPDMIDELPLVALAASLARGVSEIHGAEELRVKESNRIEATADGLAKMGARIAGLPDGFRIEGVDALHGAQVQAYDDHRIAMMLTIAGAVAEGPTEIEGADAVAISYPDFFRQYDTLRERA